MSSHYNNYQSSSTDNKDNGVPPTFMQESYDSTKKQESYDSTKKQSFETTITEAEQIKVPIQVKFSWLRGDLFWINVL